MMQTVTIIVEKGSTGEMEQILKVHKYLEIFPFKKTFKWGNVIRGRGISKITL